MRSVILFLGAIGVFASSIVLASSPVRENADKPARPVLELHRNGCQKCHGAEGELMSPGWAENRTRKDLEAILDQMVVEQAGLPPLTSSERDSVLSFHLAMSKGDPWANIIEASDKKVILESTLNSRLSATLSGKKVIPQQLPVKDDLLRWQINLPQGSTAQQLTLTVAKGTGSGKKVVRWKASERSYSQSLQSKK